MNKKWEVKTLGEVCEIYQPKTISSKEMVTDGKYVVYGANGIIGRYDKYNHEEPQLLITCRGATCGSVNVSTPMSWITGNAMVVRPKDNSLDIKYLEYLFRGGVDISKTITGAAQPQITRTTLAPVPITFPKSLAEQQRIVAILDETFATIAKAKENGEKNLQNAREIFESYLQSVFANPGDGWVERPLGDLATFRNGINFTKTSKGESIKIVGVKDFQKSFWAPLNNLEAITTDGVLPTSDMLKENDLLFVRSNGNMELIGRCLLVGKVSGKITHSGFTIRARLNGDGVAPKYLCHFLKSNNARRKMIDSGIGTNIKSLNQTTLSALVIPFPSSIEQARIVDQLEEIDAETKKLKAIYQQKLADLAELEQSILQKAFAGELNTDRLAA